MKLPRFPRKPLILAMMTLPGAAMAADAEQSKAPEQQLGAVVVTDSAAPAYKAEKASSPKLSQPLVDTPRSVVVIPKAVIEDRGAVSLRDVLKNVSGISLNAGEGGFGAGDNLTMRGFSARTDIFIDGVRDIGSYSRDPFNLESVEVVKGPSSALTGRGGSGGTINLSSKLPTREDFMLGSTSVGTDNLVRQTFDINQTLNDTTALRLNLLGHQSDAAGRDLVENNRWGFAPSIAFGQGTDTRANLSFLYLKQNDVPDYGIPYANGRPAKVDRSNFYGLEGDYNDSEASIATLQLEKDLNAANTLRNTTRYGKTTIDQQTYSANNANVAADSFRRNLRSRDEENEVLSNQTDLTSRFKTGKLEHTLVSGVEVVRETFSNLARAIPTQANTTSLENPNPNDPRPTPLIGTRPATATADGFGLFVFDTVALNKQWEVNGGVRFDRYAVNYNSVSSPVTSGTNPVPNALTKFGQVDEEFSWHGGVVYKPRRNGSIYLSYANSFNPSAESLTSISANNQGVDPEKTRNVELGTKWDLFKKRLALTAAVFRTEKTNARTPTSGSDPAVVLEGEQLVKGFELTATGQVTPELQVLASYTRLDSEIVKSNTAGEAGSDMPSVPKNSATLWADYKLNKWQLGGGAQYLSDRFTNATNTNELPSHVVWDAMVGYQVSPRVSVRLNGYNLTNKEYFTGAHPNSHVIPGAARSAVLSANYAF